MHTIYVVSYLEIYESQRTKFHKGLSKTSLIENTDI